MYRHGYTEWCYVMTLLLKKIVRVFGGNIMSYTVFTVSMVKANTSSASCIVVVSLVCLFVLDFKYTLLFYPYMFTLWRENKFHYLEYLFMHWPLHLIRLKVKIYVGFSNTDSMKESMWWSWKIVQASVLKILNESKICWDFSILNPH